MHRLILTLVLAAFMPMASQADSSLPFLKHLAGDNQLPRAWGIGLDYYTMDQDYMVESLKFELPGVSLGDPSLIDVTNSIDYYDFKADVWLFPFLNLFGTVGKVDGDTLVDLSNVPIVGLPFPLGVLPVSYDGTVYGVGFTLVYGAENWFTSATTTWTRSDLKGDFKSSVDSLSIQPRVGFIRGSWLGWVGAMYLDIDENHKGNFNLPIIGPVPFEVGLASADKWNFALGTAYFFSDQANMTIEFGFGKRDYTLVNVNYRF